MGAFGKYNLSQSDKGWGLRNLIIPEYLCAACSCSQPESSAPVPLNENPALSPAVSMGVHLVSLSTGCQTLSPHLSAPESSLLTFPHCLTLTRWPFASCLSFQGLPYQNPQAEWL